MRTQERLAELIGVHRSRIVEYNRVGWPESKFEVLAQLLDMDMCEAVDKLKATKK